MIRRTLVAWRLCCSASRSLAADVWLALHERLEGDFSEEDWEHTLGGTHFLVVEGDAVVSHGSVVPPVLEVASRPLNVGM